MYKSANRSITWKLSNACLPLSLTLFVGMWSIQLHASFAEDMDLMLQKLSSPASSQKAFSNHPLDQMLLGVNEQIEENRRIRELAAIEAERQRLEAEIEAEQMRVAQQMRADAEAARERREQAAKKIENRKRLIGMGIGGVTGHAAGLDFQGTVEMAMNFSEAVVSDNPEIARQGARQITNDYIERRRAQLNQLPQGATYQGQPSNSAQNIIAKPDQMPEVCRGYTRANYRSGGITGEPQLDAHCQQAMHYYDMYANNVNHPDARPDQLEKAYQAHVTSARLAEQFGKSLLSNAGFSRESTNPSTTHDSQIQNSEPASWINNCGDVVVEGETGRPCNVR